MNSERTQIKRKQVSAPTRWIIGHIDLNDKFILHYGEGKAFEDTRVLSAFSGSFVATYDPHTEANDPSVLDVQYDVGISNYVFNTLLPATRAKAFSDMLACCKRCIIAVRTDKVNGSPVLGYDGVTTSRDTFQTQLSADAWVEWFERMSPDRTSVEVLHNGGHFAIIDVWR